MNSLPTPKRILVGQVFAVPLADGQWGYVDPKGGWIANVYEFPSTMAQNFWIAIFAWSTCFAVTILVSLLTKPRPQGELKGLVYGLTEMPHDRDKAWYLRPAAVAIVVGIVLLILNIWFA